MWKLTLSEKQRKFAREVGGVVLGVLIALGIGEIAEAIRWEVRVYRSLSAIKLELATNRFNLVERRIRQDCFVNRLTEVGELLHDARRTGRLPNVGEIGRPGQRIALSSAFEVAKSEGVFLHVDRTLARSVAQIYGGLGRYDEISKDEQINWTHLKLIENSPGPISDDLLATLLQAWTEANFQAFALGVMSEQADRRLEIGQITVEYPRAAPTKSALTKVARSNPVCAPLIVDGKPFKAN